MSLQKGKNEKGKTAYYCVIYLEMCDIIFTDEKRKNCKKQYSRLSEYLFQQFFGLLYGYKRVIFFNTGRGCFLDRLLCGKTKPFFFF